MGATNNKNYGRLFTNNSRKTDDLIEFLNKQGYEKRSGSGAYIRNQIVIVPKKKWYWFTNWGTGTHIQKL